MMLLLLFLLAQQPDVKALESRAASLPKPKPPSGRIPVPENATRDAVYVPGKSTDNPKRIVWRHMKIKIPESSLGGRVVAAWCWNNTHPIADGLGAPLPEGFAYDPRNVRVSKGYLEFDAPAGDYIFYRVGSQ